MKEKNPIDKLDGNAGAGAVRQTGEQGGGQAGAVIGEEAEFLI